MAHSKKSPKRTLTTSKKLSTGRKAAVADSLENPEAGQKGTPEAGVLTLNRRKREDRRQSDRRTKNEPVAVERRKLERRVKVSRRRQIDPTTCERDYSIDEVEFMNALDQYKRSSGRMFPTCSEILEVIRGLGYVRTEPAADQTAPPAASIDSPAPPALDPAAPIIPAGTNPGNA